MTTRILRNPRRALGLALAAALLILMLDIDIGRNAPGCKARDVSVVSRVITR